MKNKKLAKLLSLFLTAALLTGVLLVTAAAEAVAPLKKSADSLPGYSDTDASVSADLGQTMADVSGGKALGVFQLKLSDGSRESTVSAFYFTDGSNAYIVSDSLIDEVIQDGSDDLTLVGLNGALSVSYLGTDPDFSYFYAEGLESYTPLELESTPVDEVIYFFLGADESGALGLYGGEVNLSTCQTENGYVFDSDIPPENIHIGMPVVSKDKKLVGEVYYGGGEYMKIFRFVGTDFEFAPEYALGAASEPAEPTESTKPTESAEPTESTKPTEATKPTDPDPDPKSEDKTKLYLLIGAAAVAAFLFYQKKGKKQPQQQADQGSIPLDPGGTDAGAGFDNAGNRTAPAAEGQDIYGPTVPNPSEAPRPSQPTAPREKETVPLAQWQVRCVQGPLSGRVYPLGGRLTIGRGAQCDVKFSQDAPGISAVHCQVSVKGDRVYLQDLGSSYGTFYPQNNRLNPRTDYPLHAGEVFTLAEGGASFRLEKMGAAAQVHGFAIKDVNEKTYRPDASMRLTLGRNPGCQGNFGEDDASVSGRHCVLYREGGKLYLMDLGSTNGTFFSQQEQLKPNVPYRIRRGMAFFLTTPKYTFVVTEE